MVGQEQVFGFQVAMHDAFGMCGGKPARDLHRPGQCVLERHDTGIQARTEGVPDEQLRDKKWCTVALFVRAVP